MPPGCSGSGARWRRASAGLTPTSPPWWRDTETRVGELEAEARALKRRYGHQNLSGKTEYAKKRSRVSEDMAQEAGDATEEDGAGSSKKTGPPAGHK